LLVAPSSQEPSQSAIVSSVFSVSEGDAASGESPSNLE
jgi:hypothetical protein